VRCGKLKHSFWDDTSRDMLTYISEPRPWSIKIVAIAHHAKAFDLHFILNRTNVLKWKPKLIMNGLKLICMRMENLVFLDSVCFLPFALPKPP